MEWILIFIFVVIVLSTFFIKKSPSEISYRIAGPLFSPAERSFYGVLQQAFSEEYIVLGKVRVADILLPEKGLNRSQWQIAFNKISSKHFDFVLCAKDDLEIIAALELDDKSHRSKKAQNRDFLLNSVCENAGLPLVRFPAKKGYQIQEIKSTVQEKVSEGKEIISA